MISGMEVSPLFLHHELHKLIICRNVSSQPLPLVRGEATYNRYGRRHPDQPRGSSRRLRRL